MLTPAGGSCTKRQHRRFDLRPSRRAIPPARRDTVQLRRSATGADNSGTATPSAACAFTGTGPAAMRALRAQAPRPGRTRCAKAAPYPAAQQRLARSAPSSSLRTPEAAPAPGPPPGRSAPCARSFNAIFCASPAVTGGVPAMPSLRETLRKRTRRYNPLASPSQPAQAGICRIDPRRLCV